MLPVISVENLSKKYIINHQKEERYVALRDVLANGVKRIVHKLQHPLAGKHDAQYEEFWALKDINFEIQQGDKVGIIGRNGAGKSTLLKILSRITEPTSGRVSIKGRVASLLEVGTGFHPELTGRENIYLNGAILGMSRVEIKKKFDEIVAFAEVEKFLDTPVKRYSSGMYVRLAFAVAAHLEPEILIVDEVLAVGDAQFQKKCLGKMESAGEEGRTVIFVSHNMTAIQHLCKSCIFLKNGQIKRLGLVNQVIDEYIRSESPSGNLALDNRSDRQGSGDIIFRAVKFNNKQGEEIKSFRCGETANFSFDIFNNKKARQENVVLAIGIDNNMGERIAIMSNEICGQSLVLDAGSSNISISIPRIPLVPGRFNFTLFMSANGVITDWIQDAGSFSVDESDYYGTGKIELNQGHILLDYKYIC